MIRIALACAALLSVAGCAGLPDAAAIDAAGARIAPRVARDCALSGGVKLGNTIAGGLVPVPGAALVASGLNAGWDAACSNPEETARAIGAAEEALRAAAKR